MRLSGNTVLITGGTSGIGAAFAEKFLQAGSKVIITGRREERLKKFQEDHPEMVVKTSDVADEKQRVALAQWVIETYPETNILINNAGVQLLTDLKKPVDLHRVRQETETNFIAPVHLTSLFTQHLAMKQNAAIVNISSGLAFVPIAIMPVYCATKAAIHSLTLS
ncbi:MAG: SDR family NAD(P)-dependent oxidoreductase, partial [Flavisolibacter sp.]|nr:SDR family NAD(P)-dependent oxidoreductase [Flavisolibacter sp.]